MSMTRVLVTGCSGFVSRHFLETLDARGARAEVLGVARSAPTFSMDGYRNLRVSFRQLDLLDKSGVGQVLQAFEPTHVLHLAAYSSVGYSWHSPVESFTNNTNVFLNLLDQVRTLRFACRVLSVGSSEEYGDVTREELPLREESPLRPASPYAVARVAQELLSSVYVKGYGLDLVMTRSFNHIGTHQKEVFLVPSLAKQIAVIRERGGAGRIVTGDRSIVRDFVDVRDVVRAYVDLLERGTAGEIYNVCSGRGVSIDELIATMQELAGTAASLETDPKLVRPNDNKQIVGSNAKIHAAVGWEPMIPLRESLRAILEWSNAL